MKVTLNGKERDISSLSRTEAETVLNQLTDKIQQFSDIAPGYLAKLKATYWEVQNHLTNLPTETVNTNENRT